jgi:plasmid stabilization system protein ParE
MKRTLRYHSLAQRDFVSVAAWSQAQWGAKMTRRYLDEIERQIERIAQDYGGTAHNFLYDRRARSADC